MPGNEPGTAVAVSESTTPEVPLAAAEALVSEERLVAEVSELPAATHARTPRAGRNLPAAIAVGLVLVALLYGCIYVLPALFTPVVAIAVVIATLEVANALEGSRLRVPSIPLLVASVGVVVSAWQYGASGLLVSTIVGAIVLIMWRTTEATGLMALRDTVAGIFALLWVPFMASFTILLMAQPNGANKVMFALVVPIMNDTCGYAVGVLFGKHPMAPSISPKKSWEGFAGSLVGGIAAAGLIGHVWLPDIGFGWGLAFGAVMVVVSTIGDLSESLLKRDLRIKDMGQLLPGHGGMMDRLDSMLLTAPTVYILLAIVEAISG